ncbi:MAG TPA: PaaI family thioesterase [Egibacteraceae bacterium]|nr:PaaI family thioesterase [Actinomycetota bacterium]HWB72850.1 PaaI family thioesterase [Egibacteraceae bacterium]
MSSQQADPELVGHSRFMQVLGVHFEEIAAERVLGWFDSGPQHHQPFGLVHGGVFSAVIETFASVGGYQAVKDDGRLAVGVTNVTDFLRPHRQGRLRVVAEALLQGRTQQLWQVVITRVEDGKTVARGQVRMQNVSTPGER